MSMFTPPNRGPQRRIHPYSTGKSSKNVRNPFKSPMRTALTEKKEETVESVQKEVDALRTKMEEVDKDISALLDEGYREEELSEHIDKLHRYNEIKDVGQMVLGRIAEALGTTTRDMYKRYDIDVED